MGNDVKIIYMHKNQINAEVCLPYKRFMYFSRLEENFLPVENIFLSKSVGRNI